MRSSSFLTELFFILAVDRWGSMIIIPGEFLIPALADVLSQESEWQQVFSSPQDSSQYSGQS